MPAETASWGRRLGIAALVLVAATFSFLNAGERVSLNVGVTILYRVSLVGLVFAVFLLGMATMFLFGLRQDRRIRAMLRDRALRGGPSTISHPPPDQV
jgi:hypothetical protein